MKPAGHSEHVPPLPTHDDEPGETDAYRGEQAHGEQDVEPATLKVPAGQTIDELVKLESDREEFAAGKL